MNAMSKDMQLRLQQAVDRIGGLIDGGTRPNDAIVKVASEEQFRPGHVRLLIQSYNIGKQARQREHVTDPFEKIAAFEMADPEVIIEALWPSQVKTAAQIHMETAVSNDYQESPESFLLNRVHAEQRSLLKSAQEVMLPADRHLGPSYPKFERDVPTEIDALAEKQAAVRQKELELGMELQTVFTGVTDLQHHFRDMSQAPPWFVKEALTDFAEPLVVGTLAYVEKTLDKELCNRPWTKLAYVDWNVEPYASLAKMAAAVTRIQEMQPVLDQMTKEAQDLEIKVKRTYGMRLPKSASALDRMEEEPLLHKTANQLSGALVFGAGGATGKSVVESLLNPDTDKLVEKNISAIDTPEHQRKLRQIQTELLLDDLVNNDPVISGYDPQEVSDVFNQVSQLSPEFADQRMLLTAHMRRQLAQGGVDPYEAKSIVDTGSALRNRNQIPGTPGGAPGGTKPRPSVLA